MLIAQDALHDTPQRQGDGVIGCTLPLNDGISRLPHHAANFFPVCRGANAAALMAELRQGDAADIGPAPKGNLRIPVFPDDVGVDIAGINAAALA
ncbi:MAG: hypothetical protein DDT21_02158 [Syntrophomonadaceae bacterium]|nr:hypothetical protein [Bacillota bacterium]